MYGYEKRGLFSQYCGFSVNTDPEALQLQASLVHASLDLHRPGLSSFWIKPKLFALRFSLLLKQLKTIKVLSLLNFLTNYTTLTPLSSYNSSSHDIRFHSQDGCPGRAIPPLPLQALPCSCHRVHCPVLHYHCPTWVPACEKADMVFHTLPHRRNLYVPSLLIPSPSHTSHTHNFYS
jgi:hypothetical protein